MGYPTKIQLISRKKTADQYYINFPTAIAEALELQKGEIIEWIIEDKANIIAHRRQVPASPIKVKKTLRHSWRVSKNS
jgi:bifunctional DNA-binding transcriptional regulator/antitoxin component of YhaV-PrlF toxin-antitoxin module